MGADGATISIIEGIPLKELDDRYLKTYIVWLRLLKTNTSFDQITCLDKLGVKDCDLLFPRLMNEQENKLVKNAINDNEKANEIFETIIFPKLLIESENIKQSMNALEKKFYDICLLDSKEFNEIDSAIPEEYNLNREIDPWDFRYFLKALEHIIDNTLEDCKEKVEICKEGEQKKNIQPYLHDLANCGRIDIIFLVLKRFINFHVYGSSSDYCELDNLNLETTIEKKMIICFIKAQLGLLHQDDLNIETKRYILADGFKDQ